MLSDIHLKSHQISEDGVSHLAKLKSLSTLGVTDAGDADLERLTHLPTIRRLFLNLDRLSPHGLEVINGFPKLEVLGLVNSQSFGDEHLADVRVFLRLANCTYLALAPPTRGFSGSLRLTR